MKKVTIVGLGYIGLPTAAVMAEHGYKVHGFDPVKYVVDTINRGDIHIVEPKLSDVVKKAVADGMLHADTKPAEADAFILAVPTPLKENKEPDLTFVEAAAREIAAFVHEENLIILESTSPVGTTEKVKDWIFEERPDLKKKTIYFAHCPERVLPGRILKELVDNDRIIGGINEVSTRKAVELYQVFVKGELLQTNARTAEMAKLTENAYRDVNIAFANELSIISEKMNIDIWNLIEVANHHPRVNILQPGPGVGGHCIAVDPWFLVDSCPKEARLIRTARQVNDRKPQYVIEKVCETLRIKPHAKLACLGLAFKADIDDLRESPSLVIVKKLAEKNISMYVAEPNIAKMPKQLGENKNIIFTDYRTAITNADILLLLVDHKEFKVLDKNVLSNKILIDTRGIWR